MLVTGHDDIVGERVGRRLVVMVDLALHQEGGVKFVFGVVYVHCGQMAVGIQIVYLHVVGQDLLLFCLLFVVLYYYL